MQGNFELLGNVVDVVAGTVFPGKINVSDGKVKTVTPLPDAQFENLITPGLVDAHVHIESSLLSPVEFARAATLHGTVASVSDPHEIANVLGSDGVKWMLQNASQTPFKIAFGCPSCVPATCFETAGASMGEPEITELLNRPEIRYLSEVMNFPGVINGDPALLRYIKLAQDRGKRVDGHAPGLLGEMLENYHRAGIETDHECSTLEEARQRCQLGMKVAIREGSAARNFATLWPLLLEYPDHCFFCSDDKHPDDLVLGHINQQVAEAIRLGCDPLSVLRAATLNPIRHYGLPVGLLQPGDPADLVEWSDLHSFDCKRTWIDGTLVAEAGKTFLPSISVTPVNRFATTTKKPTDFYLPPTQGNRHRVIVAIDGEILTRQETVETPSVDIEKDILKITVVNRYENTPPAVALIKNFGLKTGALASSVAHDSHNIVAVGTDDASLAMVVNEIIKHKGGLCATDGTDISTLPLPIAGLMSELDAQEAAQAFTKLNAIAHKAGCTLRSPFMTLSFMALLVIPELKISDQGLFDVNAFELIGDKYAGR